MTHHIALSSSDNKVVHQHFGRTKTFQIFSLNETGYAFVETRHVEPCCNNGEHEVSAFDNVLAVLSGCEAIVVGKIGAGASDYLTDKGMKVFVAQGYIEDVMDELQRNQARYFPAEDKV
jgi:predicted Fe-Mo cluster-binding NifX family protein